MFYIRLLKIPRALKSKTSQLEHVTSWYPMSITSQLVEHCTLLDRPVGLRSSKARLIISTITRRSTSRSSLGSIISKPRGGAICLGCLTFVLLIIFLLSRLTLAHIESSRQGNKSPQSTHTIHDKTHFTDMPIITWKCFE